MVKKARRRRYLVKESAKIDAHIQTQTCEDIHGFIKDISQTGCSIVVENSELKSPISIGDLLPLGKLVSDNFEWAFGRSTVKFVKTHETGFTLGIMFIDLMAPVDTSLSRFLNVDFSKQKATEDLEIDSENATLADFLGRDNDSTDIFTKAKNYHYYYNSLQKNDRWGYWIARKPSYGTRVKLTKKRANGRDDFIIMASNDYLGLSSHPEVIDAAHKALDKYGFGATGSPVTTGQTEEHEKLQEMLSRIYKTEATVLFNSGYAANLGAISCLVGCGDLVIADYLSHASIVDGMQQSKGITRMFKHNDMRHLELILKRYRKSANGALIVAEGVFSMDGDAAPLDQIYQLAKEHECRVMLDDAHSFGVIGPNGLGASDKFNLLGKTDLTMGTFSKICGTIGGYICGSKEVIDWINVSARSVFFSVSLPPSTVSATIKSLELFTKDNFLHNKLRENISFFVNGLRNLGFNIDANHDAAIVPLIIGDEKKLGQMYQYLFNDGVYTIPVVFPAVSKNSCRFRFTVSAAHSTADLDYVLLVIEKAIKEVGLDPKSIFSEAA